MAILTLHLFGATKKVRMENCQVSPKRYFATFRTSLSIPRHLQPAARATLRRKVTYAEILNRKVARIASLGLMSSSQSRHVE